MSLPTALAVVPAVVCALSWAGLGAALPARWLPADDRLTAALARVAAGALVFATAAYLVGRAGLFDRRLLVGATLVLAVPGARLAARELRAVRARGLPRLLLLPASAVGLAVLSGSTPPSSADALKYHLALPELWLEQGAVSDAFWRWESFNPLAVQTLYGQALALGGGETAGAVAALLAGLAVVAVFVLARRLAAGSALAGTLAATLFALQGLFTWEATATFVELPLALYAALGATFLARFATTAATGDLVWAGVAAGGAAATKYIGLLVAALLLLVALALVARRRDPRSLALAGAAALAAGGVWYAKNLIVTGNPLYALVGGGRWWTASAEAEVAGLNDAYGVDGPLVRLLALPADLLLNGSAFDRGESVSPLIFAAAALLAFSRPRLAAVTWAPVGVYLVAWWATSPQARFLVPALALLAAAGGVAVAGLAGRRPWVVAATAALALVFWAPPTFLLARTLLPPALGLESRAEAAQRLTGSYDALQRIAARVDAPIAFGGYTLTYHYPKAAIQLDTPEFSPELGSRELVRRLRAHDVGYVAASAPDETAEVPPLLPCLRRIAVVPATTVTSRARGRAEPLDLVLYRVAGCPG